MRSEPRRGAIAPAPVCGGAAGPDANPGAANRIAKIFQEAAPGTHWKAASKAGEEGKAPGPGADGLRVHRRRGLAIWQFSGLARQRRVIRLREDDLAEREKRLSTLETQIDDLTAELAAEEEKTAAQTQQIEELLTTVNSAESSASQSQYDLSEQQKELEKATDENAVLEEQVAALEKENDRLRADYDTLYAAVDAQSKKLRFMDSYVVFIEDDGTGNYHRYDCGKFLKKNFWAYSRKLAERQGYTPCAQCFGS